MDPNPWVCPQRLNPTFNSRNLALLLPVHRSSLGGLTTTILLIVAHCRLSRTACTTIRATCPHTEHSWRHPDQTRFLRRNANRDVACSSHLVRQVEVVATRL